MEYEFQLIGAIFAAFGFTIAGIVFYLWHGDKIRQWRRSEAERAPMPEFKVYVRNGPDQDWIELPLVRKGGADAQADR